VLVVPPGALRAVPGEGSGIEAELLRDVFDDSGRDVLAVVEERAEEPHGAESDGVAELGARAAAGHRAAARVAVEEEVAGRLRVVRRR
jgi:hypothetical protein